MKNLSKKNWSITAVIIGCLSILADIFDYFHPIKYFGIIYWTVLLLYIFLVTYGLYKKEWQSVLGLHKKNINRKIIRKSFWIGLLISVIANLIMIAILFVFSIPISNAYGGDISIIGLLISAIIIAPITEELMFRGFIQGVLEKNNAFSKSKFNTKTVIVLVAFLFALFHVRYIIYTETAQCVLSLFGIFILGLYLGYIRNKYQSIIPSMFAHLGCNMGSMIIMPILLIIMFTFQPEGLGKYRQEQDKKKYKNDSTYNFDTNNFDTLFYAQSKFFALHNSPHSELKQYIVKERTAFVPILYDIDTNGFVSNIRIDSAQLKTNREHSQGVYIASEVEKEAFRLVESFPQHKPYIEGGKKTDATRMAFVPIYY